MSNKLLTKEEFLAYLAVEVRKFNKEVSALNRRYERDRNARILALKPNADGRIKHSDIRKANRGQEPVTNQRVSG